MSVYIVKVKGVFLIIERYCRISVHVCYLRTLDANLQLIVSTNLSHIIPLNDIWQQTALAMLYISDITIGLKLSIF